MKQSLRCKSLKTLMQYHINELNNPDILGITFINLTKRIQTLYYSHTDPTPKITDCLGIILIEDEFGWVSWILSDEQTNYIYNEIN